MVLDCDVDLEVPIILGKPFLATGRPLVDVELGEFQFRVGEESVKFEVGTHTRPPD